MAASGTLIGCGPGSRWGVWLLSNGNGNCHALDDTQSAQRWYCQPLVSRLCLARVVVDDAPDTAGDEDFARWLQAQEDFYSETGGLRLSATRVEKLAGKPRADDVWPR